MYSKELYKRGSKDKIKYWKIEVTVDSKTDELYERTLSGYHGGALKISFKKSTRNAESIAETKAEKKMREGYVESIEQAQAAGITLSGMQAMFMTIQEAVTLLKSPGRRFLVDEKYNGVRGTYHRDTNEIISKGNKVYDIPHLLPQLATFCDAGELKFLDFELYIPGLKVTDISGAVKKRTNKSHKKLRAYIFDGLMGVNDTRTALERKKWLLTITGIFDDTPDLRMVSWSFADYRSLELIFNRVIGDGGEGLILRAAGAEYDWDNKSRRSTKMIKVKPLRKREFKVIGCSFEKRKVQGEFKDLILYTCITPEGRTFSVTPEGDVESRCIPAPESYDDLWYVVEFREYTINNIPFHGVGKGFRDVEDIDPDVIDGYSGGSNE